MKSKNKPISKKKPNSVNGDDDSDEHLENKTKKLYPLLTLKEGKEINVIFRHPWIFSGALKEVLNDIENGSLVFVQDTQGRIIGTGTFSKYSSIAIRVLDFKDVEINEEWFFQRFKQAEYRREISGYGQKSDTTGYRLVFSETDLIPGLIVDRYEDVFVIQISTAGVDRLKKLIVSALIKAFSPKSIYERSDISIRREEKLDENVGILYGDINDLVKFKEQGNIFYADILNGQKTGFFLDQKEQRKMVFNLAKGKDVLDVFSYSGAAGIYALKGGAKSVTFVDSSKEALKLCEKHIKKNFPRKKVNYKLTLSDAFDFIGKANLESYDMVILDPPALIKSRKNAESGKKAYHFLNRAGIRLVKSGGIFITSSCSHYLYEEDFAFLLRRASVQTGAIIDLISTVYQSPDHPSSIYFPESKYLKTFTGIINRFL